MPLECTSGRIKVSEELDDRQIVTTPAIQDFLQTGEGDAKFVVIGGIRFRQDLIDQA